MHKIIGLYKVDLYNLYRIPLDKGEGICYIIVTKGKPHVHIESPLATQRNGKVCTCRGSVERKSSGTKAISLTRMSSGSTKESARMMVPVEDAAEQI